MKKLVLSLASIILLILVFFSIQTIRAQQSPDEDHLRGVPIEVSIIQPENTTYADVDVVLSCQISKEVTMTSYSLDGQKNVTFRGDIILTDLSAGEHQLIVFAQDQAGNSVASETIVFTIKPHPSTLVIVSLALVGLIGLTLLIKAIKQKE